MMGVLSLGSKFPPLISPKRPSNQGCQFRFVPPGMAETFHINLKNETKRNKFHLILNLGPFRKFRPNSGRNVPVSFRLFRFGQKILFLKN